jgi:hypothetical protein
MGFRHPVEPAKKGNFGTVGAGFVRIQDGYTESNAGRAAKRLSRRSLLGRHGPRPGERSFSGIGRSGSGTRSGMDAADGQWKLLRHRGRTHWCLDCESIFPPQRLGIFTGGEKVDLVLERDSLRIATAGLGQVCTVLWVVLPFTLVFNDSESDQIHSLSIVGIGHSVHLRG